jgi:hypothetical protein
MKKIVSLALALVMIISLLVGCKGGMSSGEMPSGSDAAKLLLANERLNAQLLKTEGDIFEDGVEVMYNLAKIANDNLHIPYVSSSAPLAINLSSAVKTSTVLQGNYSGKVEINGGTFTWSGFEENNNSYDYFKNLTDNIVSTAEICAELINTVKKNVRVIEKWVDVGGVQYYLSVDKNSETLYERDTVNNMLNICKRYKNKDGKDVYELYRKQDKYEERMTYIPGQRYELSMINDYGEHSEDYFVADNSKGYWETYVVGAFPDHYNVSYFIMKNNICYDSIYEPKDGSIMALKIMSADRATDILNFADGEVVSFVDLKFSGFDGIKSVEAPADSVEYNKAEKYAALPSGENSKVRLTNGMVLNYGDSFLNGKVSINAIHVGFSGVFGYTGEICLRIEGETYEERLESLRSFLKETGLKCRRNIDSVFSGIDRAYVELDSIIKYYTWNGVSVKNEAGIGKAITKEKTRFSKMEALYTAVKDAKVLDISDTERIELNIKFAPITKRNFQDITLDGGKVSLGSVSLTIEDTTLYVKDEPYKIMLALANSQGGLVHFDMENTSSTKYGDEDKFTVTASALEFTLPALSSGSYTLVAYIATSDGIRASAYTPVTVSQILNMPVKLENISVSAAKGEKGELVLTCERIEDFTVIMTTESRIGYAEFKAAVSEKAFEYGVPSDIIEVQTDDTYTALTGSETEIPDGTYRIFYQTENGDNVAKGYIYVQYSCE